MYTDQIKSFRIVSGSKISAAILALAYLFSVCPASASILATAPQIATEDTTSSKSVENSDVSLSNQEAEIQAQNAIYDYSFIQYEPVSISFSVEADTSGDEENNLSVAVDGGEASVLYNGTEYEAEYDSENNTVVFSSNKTNYTITISKNDNNNRYISEFSSHYTSQSVSTVSENTTRTTTYDSYQTYKYSEDGRMLSKSSEYSTQYFTTRINSDKTVTQSDPISVYRSASSTKYLYNEAGESVGQVYLSKYSNSFQVSAYASYIVSDGNVRTTASGSVPASVVDALNRTTGDLVSAIDLVVTTKEETHYMQDGSVVRVEFFKESDVFIPKTYYNSSTGKSYIVVGALDFNSPYSINDDIELSSFYQYSNGYSFSYGKQYGYVDGVYTVIGYGLTIDYYGTSVTIDYPNETEFSLYQDSSQMTLSVNDEGNFIISSDYDYSLSLYSYGSQYDSTSTTLYTGFYTYSIV